MPRPDVIVKPQPWLWQPRFRPIRFLEIHATRGPTTPDKQFGATVNWMQSAGNGNPLQGWGSSCSYVLDRDGTLGIVLADDEMPKYSAGYGGAGSEWSIDEYGISYEWCQSPAQEEFTTAQYERGAVEFATKCRLYGIEPRILDEEVRTQKGPVNFSGFVRHDRCGNGYRLGKSDPGPKFRDADFVALVKERMNPAQPPVEEETMSSQEYKELRAAVDALQKKAAANVEFVQFEGFPQVYRVSGHTLEHAKDLASFDAQSDFAEVRVLKKGSADYATFARFNASFASLPREVGGL